MEQDVWIVNPDMYEEQCECIRAHTAYVYTYPFVREVWQTGCKVVDRRGRTIRKIQEVHDGFVGILDGEEMHWDVAGRYVGPYTDSPNDMRIPERFFRKNWQIDMQMSNAEWTMRYGRQHPYVKAKR